MLLDRSDTLSKESEYPELFNTQISPLLVADVWQYFPSLKMGYKKLDFLEKYYGQWDLNLNLKKTKVIIFSKQGRE